MVEDSHMAHKWGHVTRGTTECVLRKSGGRERERERENLLRMAGRLRTAQH